VNAMNTSHAVDLTFRPASLVEELAVACYATEDLNVMAFEVEARGYERRAELLGDLELMVSSGAWSRSRTMMAWVDLSPHRYIIVGEEDGFVILFRQGRIYAAKHSASSTRTLVGRVVSAAGVGVGVLDVWFSAFVFASHWWPVVLGIVTLVMGAFMACQSVVDLEKKPHKKLSVYSQVRVLERAVTAGRALMGSRSRALVELKGSVSPA
jgi:hypothetical protein